VKRSPGAIPGQTRGGRITRLGILGGTFDPVHYGHLVCAAQLREAFGLDLVLLVPCSRSPHKPHYRPAPSRHRLAMAGLAASRRKGLAVSDLETRRGGISYTIDTVKELREVLGPQVEIWLLMGMDAYLDVTAWKQSDSIVRECYLGVACRPGYRIRRLPRSISCRARFAHITAVEVSSTDVRRRLQDGLTIAFLVPERVEDYIKRHRLYEPRGRVSRTLGRSCRRQRQRR
jgi:nicotinate-nucleotide adenylyltransferase